jgi:hypothetical protein
MIFLIIVSRTSERCSTESFRLASSLRRKKEKTTKRSLPERIRSEVNEVTHGCNVRLGTGQCVVL